MHASQIISPDLRAGTTAAEASVMTKFHWLFLVSILAGPVFPLVSDLLLFIYIVSLCVFCPWKKCFSDPHHATIVTSFLLVSCWFIARISYPLGVGLHSFRTTRFPVTVLDYVPFILLFVTRSLMPVSFTEVRRTLWAMVAANIPWFPLAVAQKYFGAVFSWSLEILDLPLVKIRVIPLYKGRVSAGFGNGNILGCSLLICLIASGALLAWFLPRNRHKVGEIACTWRVIIPVVVLVCVILCSVIVLMWTGSRNTWVVVVLVAPIYARLMGISWRYILIPLLVSALLVGLSVGDFGEATQAARIVVPKIVWGRIVGLPELKPSQLSWRLKVYGYAFDMIGEKPWIGWGIGGFAPEALRRNDGRNVNHAHNAFLQLAAETGIPATFLFSVLIGTVWLSSGRRLYLLPRDQGRILLFGPYLITSAMLLLHQVSLAMFHSNQLEMIVWWSLAVPYSLVLNDTRSSISGIN